MIENNAIFTLDNKYATTRRVTNEQSVITHNSDNKINTKLFLIPHENRKLHGGLRKQGYFKTDFKHKPLITVITVVFNGDKYLEQSILSVIEQTYDNIEYIVIDGGSTDGTLDIIKQYENQIDYWISEPDKGIYDAFNKGVQCATGSWICFLGSDDYFWEQKSLFLMIPVLISAHSSVKLVYGNVALVTQDNSLLSIIGESWEITKNKLHYTMSVPHPALMHHRTWFSQYGFFDCSYVIAGDYEMLLRGRKEQAIFIPQLITGIRQGGISSNPHNTVKALNETYLARKKHGINSLEWQFIAMFLRVYIRLILQAVLGEKITFRLLDIRRRLLGRKPYWTKLK